ncbi:hypothetical protein ACU61A_18470 [Pseudonocardia sichuanensis]
MWISLAVPLAVLLAAVLLQRLEASLFSTPEADEHPSDAGVAPLALVPPPPEPPQPRRRPSPHSPTARATA